MRLIAFTLARPLIGYKDKLTKEDCVEIYSEQFDRSYAPTDRQPAVLAAVTIVDGADSENPRVAAEYTYDLLTRPLRDIPMVTDGPWPAIAVPPAVRPQVFQRGDKVCSYSGRHGKISWLGSSGIHENEAMVAWEAGGAPEWVDCNLLINVGSASDEPAAGLDAVDKQNHEVDRGLQMVADGKDKSYQQGWNDAVKAMLTAVHGARRFNR